MEPELHLPVCLPAPPLPVADAVTRTAPRRAPASAAITVAEALLVESENSGELHPRRRGESASVREEETTDTERRKYISGE
jgi:hypothetical protein